QPESTGAIRFVLGVLQQAVATELTGVAPQHTVDVGGDVGVQRAALSGNFDGPLPSRGPPGDVVCVRGAAVRHAVVVFEPVGGAAESVAGWTHPASTFGVYVARAVVIRD